jgi:hypothetical protein
LGILKCGRANSYKQKISKPFAMATGCKPKYTSEWTPEVCIPA